MTTQRDDERLERLGLAHHDLTDLAQHGTPELVELRKLSFIHKREPGYRTTEQADQQSTPAPHRGSVAAYPRLASSHDEDRDEEDQRRHRLAGDVALAARGSDQRPRIWSVTCSRLCKTS